MLLGRATHVQVDNTDQIWAVAVGAQEMRWISLSGTLGRVAWHLLGLNLRVSAAVALALTRELVSALHSLPCCVRHPLALGSPRGHHKRGEAGSVDAAA